MLTEKYNAAKNALKDKTILLTGGAGGIGFEAAKAFCKMGATVIIADIDKTKGRQAARQIEENILSGSCAFYEIDLSDERQIRKLHRKLIEKYGFIDVLFHNAAVLKLGNVEDIPIAAWETCYRVNFKAPLLLTQLFLSQMKERNSGTIVFVPSSGAAPYMGAYEVFKTAQVELCNTLAGELEGTRVFTYAIGPGLVKTETATESIKIVAAKMGMTTEEFYALNGSHILSAEEAGCGFALSVLSAEKYNGQEVGSIQVLLDCGLTEEDQTKSTIVDLSECLPLVKKMIGVFEEQYAGWMTRNVFERQWVLRDFKKTVGISAEQFQNDFRRLKEALTEKTECVASYKNHFEKLRAYFIRQRKLLQGFEKNPAKLKEFSDTLTDWIETISELLKLL